MRPAPSPAVATARLSADLEVRFRPGEGRQPSSQEQAMVQIGDEAPDFTLRSGDREQVTLSSFRGQKNVVLAFYVLAFTGG